MRLKVQVRNSKECRIELHFQDLSVRYNNGYAPYLKIKEGEEIPVDLLDADDVKKSMLVGSLKGYIDNGWVVEVKDGDAIAAQETTRLSHFITEEMVFRPEMIQPLKLLNNLPQDVAIDAQSPTAPILPEAKAAEMTNHVAAKIEPITDLALVKTFEDFERLSHFLKIRFIKDSDNLELLKDILGKTTSAQLMNNITLRLTQIKIS
jgi:hypothetical protein